MNCTTDFQLSGSLKCGQAMVNAAIPVTELRVSRIAAGASPQRVAKLRGNARI